MAVSSYGKVTAQVTESDSPGGVGGTGLLLGGIGREYNLSKSTSPTYTTQGSPVSSSVTIVHIKDNLKQGPVNATSIYPLL